MFSEDLSQCHPFLLCHVTTSALVFVNTNGLEQGQALIHSSVCQTTFQALRILQTPILFELPFVMAHFTCQIELREAQISGKRLFLSMSVRAFLEKKDYKYK